MTEMYNITLICTTHNEIGKCNSNELLKIIDEHKPEVIFEEISPAVFNECYVEMSRFTLETSAIKLYLEKQPISHIPVVGPELSPDIPKKFELMIQYPQYQTLWEKIISLEEKYGFDFLNSDQCEKLFDQIKDLEREILSKRNDEITNRIAHWGEQNIDNYENAIIKNVYNYCQKYKFDKALLFIGAAHRKSMIKKLKEFDKQALVNLNWTFYHGNQK